MTELSTRRLAFRPPARCRRLLAALLLGATLTLPVAAAPVTLNLKDADINALVESMSVLTGRNFIVDPRVKARVTLISSRPMDEKELYEVFLSVLAVHGFAAVPSGKVITATSAERMCHRNNAHTSATTRNSSPSL